MDENQMKKEIQEAIDSGTEIHVDLEPGAVIWINHTARSVHNGRVVFVCRQVVFLPHDIQTIKNTTICAGLHLGTLHKY